MEAQRDLLFLHAVGDQVFLHRKGSAPRKVTIGQAVTAVVGVPIQKDTVDARIGPQVGQDPIQLSAAGWLTARGDSDSTSEDTTDFTVSIKDALIRCNKF